MEKEELLSSQIKKLLIIEDHSIFREGLVSLFEEEPDFELVGDAGDIQEGMQMAFFYHPDIILMDFALPDGTGLDATAKILTVLPDCKVVFLSVYEEDENLFAAIRAGAKGYLSKNISGSNLVTSLRSLYHGQLAISRSMASHVIEEFSHFNGQKNTVREELLNKISRREADILCELQDDISNLEIASRLEISENTVKYHIRNILKKLGVQNRWEAGLIAKQFGLIRKTKTP